MEKILINVDYSDDSGKYWQDSYLKNKVIKHDPAQLLCFNCNIAKQHNGGECPHKSNEIVRNDN